MTQELDKNVELAPVVEEFTHPVTGDVYAYSQPLALQQVFRANALWEFRTKLKKRDNMSLRDMEMSGGQTIDLKFYATLLRLRLPDGTLRLYDPKHEEGVYNFICTLPATDIKRLEGIMDDFFTCQGKSEIGLVEQLSGIMQLASMYAQGSQPGVNQPPTSLQNTATSPTSQSQENLTGE